MLALLLVSAGAALSAHRRDEYLQAARIAIDPERVELALDLTPGIAVAEEVLADIDRDADRSISASEGRAYAERVVGSIGLEIDGIPLRAQLVDSAFPAIAAVVDGEGTARVRVVASLPPLAAGAHHLRYRNDHRPDRAAYLANALVPADARVSIAGQRRSADQRELVIDYTLGADAATELRQRLVAALSGLLILVAVLWWRTSHAAGANLETGTTEPRT